jgi:hypothetical protein
MTEMIHDAYQQISIGTDARGAGARVELESRYKPIYKALHADQHIPNLLEVLRWKRANLEATNQARAPGSPITRTRSIDSSYIKTPSLSASGTAAHRSGSLYSDESSFIQRSNFLPLTAAAKKIRRHGYYVDPLDLQKYTDVDGEVLKPEIYETNAPDSLLSSIKLSQHKRSTSLRSVASRSSAATNNVSPTSNSTRLQHRNSMIARRPLDTVPQSAGLPARANTPPASPSKKAAVPPDSPTHGLRNSLMNRLRKVTPGDSEAVVSGHSDAESFNPPAGPVVGPRRGSTSTNISELWSPDSSDMEHRKSFPLGQSHAISAGQRFTNRLRGHRHRRKSVDVDSERTDGDDDNRSARGHDFSAAFTSLTPLHNGMSNSKPSNYHHHQNHKRDALQKSQMGHLRSTNGSTEDDPLNHQIPWREIPGLDISGPIFPDRQVKRREADEHASDLASEER